jgi:hypothetical protein
MRRLKVDTRQEALRSQLEMGFHQSHGTPDFASKHGGRQIFMLLPNVASLTSHSNGCLTVSLAMPPELVAKTEEPWRVTGCHEARVKGRMRGRPSDAKRRLPISCLLWHTREPMDCGGDIGLPGQISQLYGPFQAQTLDARSDHCEVTQLYL